MLERGMKISRIGGEPVDGVVMQVTVDMGDEPGTIVEVAVGETSRKVLASACEVAAKSIEAEKHLPELHVEQSIGTIGRDGDTMPSGEIDHVVASVN